MSSTSVFSIITGGALTGRLFAQLMAEDSSASESFSEEVAPGSFVGPYMLEEVVGQGGGGIVFRAIRNDGRYATRVAIKILRPHTAPSDAAFRECQMLAQVSHPAIPKIHDAGVLLSGERWFAMELVTGVPIDEYFASRPNSAGRRLGALRNLCDGLVAVHETGIVHRDIKPANVLVDGKGQARLIDFGVAVEPARAPDDATPRAMTLMWASPEQLAGAPVSKASDVYQFGLLIERLMGESTRLSTLCWREALRARNLCAVARRATAEDPDSRYPDARALARDLARVAAGLPTRAQSWRLSDRLFFGVMRHARLTLLLVVLALVTGIHVLVDRQADRVNEKRTDAALTFINGLVDQANPARQGGTRKSAVSVLDQAAELLEGNGGLAPGDRLSLATRIVELYIHLAEPEAGADVARSVLASIDPAQAPCASCYFKLMLEKARALSEADQLDASAVALDVAETFSSTLNTNDRAVAAYVLSVSRANLHVLRGEFDLADAVLGPVLSAPSPQDPLQQEYLILAHIVLGFTLAYSDTERELEHFTRAHEIASRLLGPRHRWTLTSAELMASSISDTGDHDRAIGVLERSRREAEEYLLRDGTIHPVLSRIEATMSYVYQQRGDARAALESIDSSIERLVAYDPEAVELVPRLILRGRARRAVNDLEQARDDFHRAAALAAQTIGVRGPHNLLSALGEAARVEIELGLALQAAATADELEKTLREAESLEPLWAASSIITIARARAANLQVGLALVMLDRARPLVEALGSEQRKNYEQQIDATLEYIQKQHGNGKAALAAIDDSIERLQREAPASSSLASRFLLRGQMRRDAGELDAALGDFLRCAALARSSANAAAPHALLTAQAEAVRMLLTRERTAQAGEIAVEMENLLNKMESPDPAWRAGVLITVARVEAVTFGTATARAKLKLAAAALEQLPTDDPQRTRYEQQIAELHVQWRGG